MSKYDSWKLASLEDARHPLDEARDRIKQLEAVLAEIIVMADAEADADDGIPNFAMRILTEAEKVL